MQLQIYDSKGNKISCTNTIKGNTLTINPKSDLKKGMKYSIVIHSRSVKDLSGNKYLYKGAYTFTRIASAKTSKFLAYYMFSDPAKYLTTAQAKSLKDKGVKTVFVCVRDGSGNYYYSSLQNAINKLHPQGIKVIAWVNCFHTNIGFVNPITATTYKANLISKIKYISSNYNCDGIQLDYCRFPGTAHYYSQGTSTITTFVKNFKTVVPKNKSLSIACFAEGSMTSYYYGQNYTQLGKYVDYFCPMAYKGNYGKSSSWIKTVTNYIVENDNNKPVYTTLTTYYSDFNLRSLTATKM